MQSLFVGGLSILLVATSGLFAAPRPEDESEQKYDLSYKFSPGEVVRWKVVHRATVKTTIQGSTQTAQTKSESIKAWQITEVDQARGDISLVHLVERIKMINQVSGRAKVEYDSESGEKPPVGFEAAAQAVGIPLTEIRMNPKGKIIHRVERHIQPGGGSDTPMAIPLPAQPVAVGHVWSEPHDIVITLQDGQTRKISTRRRFELKNVAENVATIGIDYQVLTPVQDPAVEAQLVQNLYRGEMRFDLKAGRPISQQLDVDKRVRGFSGPSSSMQYVMRLNEEVAGSEGVAEKRTPAGPPLLPSSYEAQLLLVR